jgi:hypothetical protein
MADGLARSKLVKENEPEENLQDFRNRREPYNPTEGVFQAV